METVLKGAMLCGSLIMAIGAQNAFVLKQGLLRRYIFWVCLLCFFCDCVLMGIGVAGIGGVLGRSPLLSSLLSLAGGLFLAAYGLRSFRSAFSAGHGALTAEADAPAEGGLKTVLSAALAVTLLNPHVYIDTVMPVGGIAVPLNPGDKFHFWLGAVGFSGIWFFGIGYGARLLQPLFARPRAWQVLEILIGIMMWWPAWGLLAFFGGKPCFKTAGKE